MVLTMMTKAARVGKNETTQGISAAAMYSLKKL